MIKQIFLSIGGGTTSTLTYLTIAYLLDYIINPKISNIIALFLGAVLNFIFQSNVFLTKSLTQSHIYKYIIVEMSIILSNQLSVMYGVDNKNKYITYIPEKYQKYYNTIMRIIVSAIVGIVISFPLRKYWVFI